MLIAIAIAKIYIYLPAKDQIRNTLVEREAAVQPWCFGLWEFLLLERLQHNLSLTHVKFSVARDFDSLFSVPKARNVASASVSKTGPAPRQPHQSRGRTVGPQAPGCASLAMRETGPSLRFLLSR